MKTNRYLPHLSFFSIFLLFGFWAGQRIGNSSKPEQPAREPIATQVIARSIPFQEATVSPTSIFLDIPPVPDIRPAQNLTEEPRGGVPQFPTDQRNLLVIGVDDLSSTKPRLESIWLIIYRTDTPHFMFVPIYPTAQAHKSEQITGKEALPELLRLNSEKALNQEFLEALEEIDFMWTDHIILDKIALSDVIEFLGGVGEASGLDGASIVAGIPSTEFEPQESLRRQAKLIQELCLSVTNLTLEDHWRLPILFGLIPNHAVTSLEMAEIEKEWQSQLMQIPNVKCEFPTLEGTATHP